MHREKPRFRLFPLNRIVNLSLKLSQPGRWKKRRYCKLSTRLGIKTWDCTRGPSRKILYCLLLVVFSTAILSPGVHGAEGGETVAFPIRGYEIEGNTVLSEKALYRALKDHTGKEMTATDVESARDALESLYHQSGYPTILVNIPQQRVEDGLVRLEVIESKIRRVRVTGNRYYTMEKILGALPSIQSGKILYVPVVRQELARLNRNPDFKVSPVLSPAREPGLIDVELKVKDKRPLHGSLEINNRNTHDTSDLRLNAMLRYDNLWQMDHSISLQYQTSPQEPDEVQVFAGSYVLPAPWNKDHLMAFYGVVSNSRTAFGEGFQVNGEGNIFGLRYVIPLPPNGSYNHNLTLGADYKDFDETLGFSTEGEEPLRTPMTYLPFSISYSSSVPDSSGFTQFSGGLNMSFRGLVSDPDQFAIKRFRAKANYLFARLGVERTQKLPAGMQLYFKADGQIADQPLISNEQYGAGGMESVRGYKESEAFGDHAFHGSLELSFPDLVDLSGFKVTPYLFYDYAYLKIMDPLPEQDEGITLQGLGGGLRGEATKYISFQVDVAMALEDTAQVKNGDYEFYGRVKYAF